MDMKLAIGNEIKTSKEVLTSFVKYFPNIVQDMKNSDHGYNKDGVNHLNSYHMESSVWTHTMMVFKEAITRYPGYPLLHIAVLLHDIGKAYVREEVITEERTKTTFYGHEGVSTYKAIDILNSEAFEVFGLTKREKLLVICTVAAHGDYFDSFHSEKNIEKMLSKFSGSFYHELFDMVRMHLVCDHNGRISLEDHNSDEIEDFNVRFGLGREAFGFTKEGKPLLFVLVGPPCSGKSTYIKNNLANFTVISRDDTLMKYGDQKYFNLEYSDLFRTLTEEDHKNIDLLVIEKFMTATKNRESIVIDMTNMSPKSRRKWSQGASNIVGKEYYKQAVVFFTGYEELLVRNMVRYSQEGKNIPEKVLLNMCKNFKLPMHDEYDNIEFIM
jgi:predicted kinase